MDTLKRRYELKFEIGADSWDDLLHYMKQFVDDMRLNHPDLEDNHKGVSAGYGASYSYDVKFDPEMTGERHREALRAWMAERKQSKARE